MKYVFPTMFQIFVMLSDLIVLAVIAFMTYTFGIMGLVVSFLMCNFAMKATGGWFYSWKPSNIRSFFVNWEKNMNLNKGKI